MVMLLIKKHVLVSITNSAREFSKNISEETRIKETKFNLASYFQRASKVPLISCCRKPSFYQFN